MSRDDVAELIALATFDPNAANVTLGIAGAAQPTGGIRSEMSWDPARGMHYRAVEVEDTVFEGTDVGAVLSRSLRGGAVADVDELREKNHAPYVRAFVALLAGVAVAVVRGVLAVVGYFLSSSAGAAA